jgi:hypothetical protein
LNLVDLIDDTARFDKTFPSAPVTALAVIFNGSLPYSKGGT